MLIRVWMRTAVRKQVTSFGTFLSTITHESCHHLDFKLFGFADSWHTRGFYERVAALYHHARGTPLRARKSESFVNRTRLMNRVAAVGVNRVGDQRSFREAQSVGRIFGAAGAS